MTGKLMQARFAIGRLAFYLAMLGALSLMTIAAIILWGDNETLGAFALNVFYAAVSFLFMLALSMYLDHRIETSRSGHFKKVIEKIHEDPIATAVYYGLRAVGLLILASQFIRH